MLLSDKTTAYQKDREEKRLGLPNTWEETRFGPTPGLFPNLHVSKRISFLTPRKQRPGLRHGREEMRCECLEFGGLATRRAVPAEREARGASGRGCAAAAPCASLSRLLQTLVARDGGTQLALPLVANRPYNLRTAIKTQPLRPLSSEQVHYLRAARQGEGWKRDGERCCCPNPAAGVRTQSPKGAQRLVREQRSRGRSGYRSKTPPRPQRPPQNAAAEDSGVLWSYFFQAPRQTQRSKRRRSHGPPHPFWETPPYTPR